MSDPVAVGVIFVTMAMLAAVEAAVPLQAVGRWNRVHRLPNLAFTVFTIAIAAVLNAAIVLALHRLEADDRGLLRATGLPAPVATAVVVLTLDFATYMAHVFMHASPALWRFHRMHHADPAVDVTTAFRQHPGEGLVRYAFMAAAAVGVGASPAAFALYRVWSAVNALLEHANIRAPQRLDDLGAWLIVTPNMHKVHHSRRAAETNTNYGNILSLFDRIFSTFTPAARGTSITYGLHGFDDPAVQTTAGLLALPFATTLPSPGRGAPAPRSGSTAR